MLANDWGALSPRDVSKWINFDRNNIDWQYESGKAISMACKQAEGVAYLWNLLSQHNVALLADEVGMGKTFQALGVAAMLWKMKPDAKVLVMAPNRDICAHWRREYASFISSHYREVDHCVKNAADFGPVQSIKTLKNLEDLACSIESGPAHFYLTTIHSLSGLIPSEEKGGGELGKAGEARKAALKIHQSIKHALGDQPFDLIIIDEAHYFRNVDGGSQRVAAAIEFFGDPKGDPQSPIAHKTLLLTATPSHTKMNDVESILSYFKDIGREPDRSVEFLMNKYGLRRFRLMEANGKHFSKHQYRHEQALSSNFKDRPKSEMFFALYQKKLVTELNFNSENKKILYGFLEGFESVGREARTNQDSAQLEDDKADEVTQGDYVKASDTLLLARLTGQYFEKFKKLPDHPKYSDLVEKCTPVALFETLQNLHEDKHLVFVRRIPSVRELTQRINESYDEILAAKIYGAWGLTPNDEIVKKWRNESWSRQGFIDLVDTIKSNPDIDVYDQFESEEDNDTEAEDSDAYLGSKISYLFVVIKGKKGSTDCSNVSLRFRKPESIFSLFLEPSIDYKSEGYKCFYETTHGGVKRSSYEKYANDKRLSFHKLEHRELPKGYSKKVMPEMKTVWSLIYPILNQEEQDKLSAWIKNSPSVVENFSNYIKTGFLFASPVMVELYSWFTEFNRASSIVDAQEKYQAFMSFVELKIEGSLMLCYFKAALDTFEDLCEKITDHKLTEWSKEWRELKSLQNPAWYASGQSSNRQRLILGFNSPFYPNVLVATSVFQEGVNLHLQCRKVHHYGIAWTPGDNEQRVGRVDRLFGKVNSLLKSSGKAELEINYPFLKNTFDEEQLASFIVRKSQAEEKMDACTQIASERNIELTQVNWRNLLRVPSCDKSEIKDPYGAKFHEAIMPSSSYKPYDNHQESDLVNHVAYLLSEIIDKKSESILFVVDSHPNVMLIVDPLVETDGQSGKNSSSF